MKQTQCEDCDHKMHYNVKEGLHVLVCASMEDRIACVDAVYKVFSANNGSYTLADIEQTCLEYDAVIIETFKEFRDLKAYIPTGYCRKCDQNSLRSKLNKEYWKT